MNSNTIHHADLVARALNQLPGDARQRVDAAVAADPALQTELERISQHLLLYDHATAAPAAPAFDRLAARLDAEGEQPADPADLPRPAGGSRRSLWIGAAAAAVLTALLFAGALTRDPPATAWVEARLGPGVEVVRDGARLLRVPVGSERALSLRARDWVLAERPAELQLTGRVRTVLDGGATLRIDGPHEVSLREGRAWFEVEPGSFRVETPRGTVEVLGTAFEVDLTGTGLAVRVAEGTVRVGAQTVPAGFALERGNVRAGRSRPAAWFRTPRITLGHRGDGEVLAGAPLELDIGFANDGYVPIRAGGPTGLLSPLRIEVWRLDGEGRRDGDALPLSIHAENVVSGASLLEPGRPVILVARETRTVAVRLRSPFRDAGTYRLRAWYGDDEGPTPSNLLDIEVRR
jgi:hypothetical protein